MPIDRLLYLAAGSSGALGVLLGAFGAHALRSSLSALDDGVLRLGWWQTASHYHLIHALALGVAAFAAGRTPPLPLAGAAGACFALGTLLFCGSLYAMTLTGFRPLGAVTPVGGLLLAAGWLCLALGATRGG